MSYEDNYKRAEDFVKQQSYEDTAWDNGRNGVSERRKKCVELGHNFGAGSPLFNVQGNPSGSKNIYGCHICRYYGYYDCSD